ncbi:hypothetical protein H5410_037418 [Solanum commersonii]|uniref:Uncharacterized protein n=1 Tax=Solanum commersonii TaxID=4109 RepID=A0A9J5Y7Z1_SOLCO|nr:hypothetical protein H5410_037418 [Solanum commersonii]
MAVVESGSNDTGCGTHFSSKQSPNGNSAFTVESEISCFKRLTSREFRGESSGDLRNAREASFEASVCAKILGGEAFGDRSEGKRSGTVSWSTRGRLSGRLWLSLVRLSMLRHLFIDLLEYRGVRVLSMLNFYSFCLRPYFGKVLDYAKMSLDIIEYPYLVVYMIILI